HYRAAVSNGYIEDEIVHAFGGTYEGPVAPDPAEVAEWKWMPFTALAEDLTRRPELYTIWLRHYFREHYGAIAAGVENRGFGTVGVTPPPPYPPPLAGEGRVGDERARRPRSWAPTINSRKSAGVTGHRVIRTRCGRSASSMAEITAAAAGMVPTSPAPLAP